MKTARLAFSICFVVLAFCGNVFAQKPEQRRLFTFEKDGKRGYMDAAGKVLIQPRFDGADVFSEGLAGVSTKDKWGYIDESGEMVIPPSFDTAHYFSEGLAAVSYSNEKTGEEDRFGYIDKQGRIVIKPQFKSAYEFSGGLARIESADDKIGYVDRSGKVFYIDPSFQWGEVFSEGLAAVTESIGEGKAGYIDSMGHVVISPIYDQAGDFSEGLACVSINGKFGYIDVQGNAAISPRFDGCSEFSEGLAPVKVGDKWGYIDRTGEIVIEPSFNVALGFSEGLAVVKSLSKRVIARTKEVITTEERWRYGFIDKSGKFVIKPQFPMAFDFRGGLAAVNLSVENVSMVCGGSCEKYGYVDRTGKLIWKNFE